MYQNVYFLLVLVLGAGCILARIIPKSTPRPSKDKNSTVDSWESFEDEPYLTDVIITEGENVQEGEIPFMIAVFKNGYFICGAVLISSTYALSAKHCFDGSPTETLIFGYGSVEIADLKIKTGIQKIYVREDIELDLAIIKFKTPVKFSKNIQPAKLPDENDELSAGKLVTVAGWGKTEYDGLISFTLQKIEIPIVDFDKCQKALKQTSAEIDVTINTICAGYDQGGADSCQGDSGGPLFVNGTLFGTVVGGYKCGLPNVYGLYTKIASTPARTWIKSVTGL